MSLLTKQAPIDPHDAPLNSLVAQEQVDVNFISRNNFNNNAYRSNFGSNNPRPFPSNNYGNNNTYPSTKNSTSELESMLKDFITTQKAFNKSVEEKLDKLEILSSSSFYLAHPSLSLASILMFSIIWTWIAFMGVVFLSCRGEVLILSISTS